jgi:hydrogenase maturation factor
VDKVFQQISNACEGLGISLIGGHTEITYGIDRILVVGQMMGEVQEGGLIRTGGASPGDVVLLSKGVFVEGTSVIARERERELRAKGVSDAMIGRAKQFLFDPGLSVVEEARLAVETAEISAMHDITEGGLANGLNEIAMASGVQLEVQEDRIPVFEEARMMCELFGLNPMGVIGSGSLIITARPEEADKVLENARFKGKAITKIGRVTKKGRPAVTLAGSDGAFPLPYFDKDEIVKIFS